MKEKIRTILASDNANELFVIGQKYMASGNYKIAFEAFNKARTLGHVKSLTGLGILIASGKYRGKYTYTLGIKYLEEAISKGDIEAKSILEFYRQEKIG
jgi:TPR repeat protein